MTERTIDLNLQLNPAKTVAGGRKAVETLKDVEAQANRTREKMEKLASVGNKMALVGGAIVAPFLLAMKKYVDTAKETEPISKRLVDLNKKWEESQVRLGRVTAEVVLPTLEKAVGILDKVISFAEKNPGIVKAALTIGTTLVILGGIISTTAQLVSVVATVQGLAAALASHLGYEIVGGAGGAAAGAGAGGTAAAFAAVVPLIISGIAAWAGANLGLIITNALTGQNYTMTDLGNTAKLILALNAKGLDTLISWFGGQTNFFGAVSGALGITAQQQNAINQTIANNQTASINATATNNASVLSSILSFGFDNVAQAIWGIFFPKKADGGYAGAGLYQLHPHEFVMNANTTRNAERAIGGRLTQSSAAQYMTNNFQMGSGMTIRQTRKQVQASEQRIYRALGSALGE